MVAFKALLVEGTSGVGKSTLIDALIRRHVSSCQPRKVRTLVHLAQSHTYGPLAVPENNRILAVDANLRHLERIVGAPGSISVLDRTGRRKFAGRGFAPPGAADKKG
jgi:GTPase SAR1 family protein